MAIEITLSKDDLISLLRGHTECREGSIMIDIDPSILTRVQIEALVLRVFDVVHATITPAELIDLLDGAEIEFGDTMIEFDVDRLSGEANENICGLLRRHARTLDTRKESSEK